MKECGLCARRAPGTHFIHTALLGLRLRFLIPPVLCLVLIVAHWILREGGWSTSFASGTLVAGLHPGHLEGVGGHVGGLVGGRELDRVLVLAVH